MAESLAHGAPAARRQPGAAARSPCRRCGRCCRVISLDYTKRALADLARAERDRLARNPEHVHRLEILRLLGDVRFLRRHFTRISRRRAARVEPVFAQTEFDGRAFYTCDQLTPEGSCRAHATRPALCAGYPWYGSAPSARLLVITPCGYEEGLHGSEAAPR